jgi:hypothetical protein
MNSHDQEPVVDAHLKAALRYAPDAGVTPPEALSQEILRHARDALSEAPTRAPARAEPAHQSASPAWLKGLRAFWDALGHRPTVGATASLMVATVLGVMWWGKSPEEAPPPPARTATVQPTPEPMDPMPVPLPVPAQAALPSTAKAPEAPPVGTFPRVAIPKREQPAVPRSRTPTAAAQRRDFPDASPAESSGVSARRMAEAHQAQADAHAHANPDTAERMLLRGENLDAPSAVAAAPVEASVPVPAVRLPMAGARSRSRTTDLLPANAPAPMGVTPSPRAAANAQPLAASSLPNAASTAPVDASQAMRTLARQLSQAPSIWMWRQGMQAPQASTPSVAAFMARVQAATNGKWSRADPASEGGALVHWRLMGPEPHSFSLRAGQLCWTRPDGGQWVADVDAAEVDAWVLELATMR